MPIPIPPKAKDLLSYDPETGLVTRQDNGEPWGGRKTDRNYMTGSIDGRVFYQHRVIWFLQTGRDPGELTPDHIDGNGLNNRWSNLRLATQDIQARNNGGLGYSWEKNREKFQVYFTDASSKKKSLGTEECPLLARIVHLSKAREVFPDISFLPRVAIKGNQLILAGRTLRSHIGRET
jgi:hypothetical protein